MFKLHYTKDLQAKGFYKEGIHHEIPFPNINIDSSLHTYLISLGNFKLKNEPDLTREVYTMEDIVLFEKINPVSKYEPTTVDELLEQNAQLVLSSAMKDAQIEQLNQTVSELVITVAMGGLKNGLC